MNPDEREIPDHILSQLGVSLQVTSRPAWPRSARTPLTLRLIPQCSDAGAQVVSFGLPFGPDVLEDDRVICVRDPSGREVPAFTRPLAWWRLDGRKATIRSALVQFELDFPGGSERHVTLAWDRPRTRSCPQTPVDSTRVVRKRDGYDFHQPRVLTLLPPEWMCESLVAWQQVPAWGNTAAPWFDEHLLKAFPGSLGHLRSGDFADHLYDRTTTYAKIYIRHGEAEHLLAALEAGDFYLRHLGPDGFFDLKQEKDFKYVYTENSALLYLLTGDGRYRAAVERAIGAWPGWFRIEYPGEGFWTERHMGFGLAAWLHAYEITGEPEYLARARRFFEAVFSLQVHPLDGKPPDGAWLHTGESHTDGDGWTTSPWMSAILCDGIWKLWMVTGDLRCAASLAMYARFLLRHGIMPDGTCTWYMANSPGRGRPVPSFEGPNHNVEAAYILAMGYYLSGGTDQEFLAAVEKLWPEVMNSDPNKSGRRFAMRFRETSMLVWFLEHAGRPASIA